MINKSIIKRVLYVCMSLVLLLVLSSCAVSDFIKSIFEDDSDIIYDISDQIRASLIYDVSEENFKNLFCEKVKNSEDFNDQSSAIYEFINQNKDIDEKFLIDSSLYSLNEKDSNSKNKYIITTQYTYKMVTPTDEVETWYYCHYSFTFFYQVSSDDSDYVGLHYITLKYLNTDYNVTVGTNLYTD